MTKITDPKNLLPSPPSLLTASLTLADVIAAVRASELPPERQQRIGADIAIVASWLGRGPEQIAARPAVLRGRLSQLHPVQLGISAKRKSNILSNLRRGFEIANAVDGRPLAKPVKALVGPWRDLHESIKSTWRVGKISQFMRYCAEHQIAPDAVDDAAFDAWGAWRAAGTTSLARDPERAVHQARRAWNSAVANVSGWPEHTVTVPKRQVRVTLDLDTFPGEFRADLNRFFRTRGVKTASESRSFREAAGTDEQEALSESKSARCVQALCLAATAAVEEGIVPAEEVTSIASILTPAVADATLFGIVERRGLSEYVLTVAKNLKSVATRWLELSADDWADWDALTVGTRKMLKKKIGFDPYRMTRTNRKRLAQFTDPQAVSRLFSYPFAVIDELEAERRQRRRVTHEMSLHAMSAIAVAILTTLPLRRGSLQVLQWDRHVILPPRPRQSGRLSLEPHEVKNRRELAAPLAPELVELLNIYRRHYWPVLTDDPENAHVFPAAAGSGPRALGQLAGNVVKRLRARTGLVMHLHLFRHVIATLALTKGAEAGDILRAASLVEGLLGASPGSRVTKRYSELTSAMAATWLDETIARPNRPRARERREWRR